MYMIYGYLYPNPRFSNKAICNVIQMNNFRPIEMKEKLMVQWFQSSPLRCSTSPLRR
ncbi:hypothetical protein HMPREF9446_03104 [Bacteroides fluxus YIT 12057]|uniref:Uncharacterized protein n=1 Tax=Bacteroides fluxus YIT 12057 TaxID=763034 RepID=F3PWG6_9BACE|nr:hypothetical protein HMPREF9446_03104 [Bacteroides fluxus YIT 12057]